MTSSNVLAAVVAAGFLTACTVTDVDRVRTVEPTDGTAFTRALTGEYRELAVQQGEELNVWSNANHSADKGLRSARGEVVLPDIPVEEGPTKAERCIKDDDARAELADARAQLLGLLDDNARDQYPQQSARAQGRYDCWIAEAEFSGNDAVMAACRQDFHTIVAELEAAMAPEPEPEPEPAPEPEPEAVAPEIRTVLFGMDRAEVAAGMAGELDAAAALAAEDPQAELSLTGHADRVGPEDYNLQLSIRRAENVRDALVARGVDPERISVAGRGEAEPAIPTADGVAEPANRRVEIVVQ